MKHIVGNVSGHVLRYRGRMLKPLINWLRDVPVRDPIDKRNAPIMQVLLFTVGTTLPINWARHMTALEVPSGWMHVMLADMGVAACALLGVVAIRRGHLRVAIYSFCLSLLVSLTVGYGSLGFEKHMVDQTSQMLLLVVSGLVIGRRALWIVFLALMAIFAIGTGIDASKGRSDPYHFLLSSMFAYGVVTLVLDRCITALRGSLEESEARRIRLEHEVAERERVQAQLIHAQKMDLAGRMASGIAHDFNNILSVIVGLSQERHRLDDPAGSQKQDAEILGETLHCVEKSALRGMEIARKLLDFSRNDAPQPKIIDLRLALAGLRPLLKQMFPPGVILSYESGTDPAFVRADLSQLELAVLNIAANARDAMPQGGQFRIGVKSSEEAVQLILADSGLGMPEEVRVQAFEPFFSTKPAGSGTGLGLATSQSVVLAAQGNIRIESTQGQGTSVIIDLPLARPDQTRTIDQSGVRLAQA